jgi:hypothetical protein
MKSIAWFRGMAIFAAIVRLDAAVASETRGEPAPRLALVQVASLALKAMNARGPQPVQYVAKAPEFDAQAGMWHVFFKQKGPLYIVDGDMVVVVNDRTGKACVGQMMMPPGPCT